MNIDHRRSIPRVLVLAAAALLLLTGCSPSADSSAPEASAESAVTAGQAVTIEDAWVKAAPEGMTAAFGILSNPTDRDVTIVSAQTDAAEGTQLHETVADDSGAMVMKEVDGGFTIPAHGSFELAPGANHLMLMGLTAPVEAGAEVPFTLTFSDHSTMSFTAPAKDFAGAEEHYSDGSDADQDQ
ncbi:copper chaperone PCu(A)C [Microbacterium sp. ARD32]|uniref:copper chaperone PCu(A)C n=1 Tax=Microbacterium sp. ARD32 TaxID=2962577 RepID=UPI002881CF9C|nr:copper chaperone PCu(A)C [Microbacterium sp. ARD32]MDT0156472.1 copper chaperone PCu(A)C [Microbacterium sp. ARD32]